MSRVSLQSAGVYMSVFAAIGVFRSWALWGWPYGPRGREGERPLRIFTGLLPLIFAIGIVLVLVSAVANAVS